ncbi:MAG: NAD(P)-dependent oxidoreductase [Chloroflexi bacterium]|nr:NAD(P)-dependent oxidoreductase [Chloroflexota bacterium]
MGGRTVLVTGATGFIGGWVAEAMYLSELGRVRAGIKNWAHAARLARWPIEIVPCDVLDPDQLALAMSGADLVVHCAVGNRVVVVEGTRNVLAAAQRSGVERVVHLSTAEVYGNASGNIAETCGYQYTGSEYADSKIDAEKLCWEFSSRGLPVTVLRPSIVYGPFSETWTVNLAARLQSGNWATYDGYGDGICNLVYIDDLISAIVIALTHPRAVGEAFNIVGPQVVTWNQYFESLNAALGLPELRAASSSRSRVKSAATDLIRSSSKNVRDHFDQPIGQIRRRFDWADEMVSHLKRLVKSTPTARELQNLYSRRAIYIADKACHVLGWEPQTSLEAGLKMSVAWLRLCPPPPSPVGAGSPRPFGLPDARSMGGVTPPLQERDGGEV